MAMQAIYILHLEKIFPTATDLTRMQIHAKTSPATSPQHRRASWTWGRRCGKGRVSIDVLGNGIDLRGKRKRLCGADEVLDRATVERLLRKLVKLRVRDRRDSCGIVKFDHVRGCRAARPFGVPSFYAGELEEFAADVTAGVEIVLRIFDCCEKMFFLFIHDHR